MSDALFDLAPAEPAAESSDPKSLRELLFADLVEAIENEIADADVEIDPARVYRTDSPRHTYAWHEVQGMRRVLAMVRTAQSTQTQEEYLIADRARSRLSPPTAAELDCARHQDQCPICQDNSRAFARVNRQLANLEELRRLYNGYLHQISGALGNRITTIGQVAAALGQVSKDADRHWRRGLDAEARHG